MRLLVCIAFISLLCIALPHSASGAPKLKVLSQGEYALAKDGVSQPKLISPGLEILAAPGKRLGFEFMLEPGGKNQPQTLTLVLKRPPGQLDSGEPRELRRYLLAYPGERSLALWEMVFDFEAIPGIWELELYQGEELLARQSFNLLGLDKNKPQGLELQPASPEPENPNPLPAQPTPTEPAPPASDAPEAAAQTSVSQETPAAAQEKKPPAPAKPQPQIKPEAPAKQVFVLQAGSFSDPENARHLAAKLAGQGYAACVSRQDIGKNKRYAVYLGKYASLEQANRVKQAYQAKAQAEPVLKILPDFRCN